MPVQPQALSMMAAFVGAGGFPLFQHGRTSGSIRQVVDREPATEGDSNWPNAARSVAPCTARMCLRLKLLGSPSHTRGRTCPFPMHSGILQYHICLQPNRALQDAERGNRRAGSAGSWGAGRLATGTLSSPSPSANSVGRSGQVPGPFERAHPVCALRRGAPLELKGLPCTRPGILRPHPVG